MKMLEKLEVIQNMWNNEHLVHIILYHLKYKMGIGELRDEGTKNSLKSCNLAKKCLKKLQTL